MNNQGKVSKVASKPNRIKKTAELGVALSAITVLLAGCLGGTSSSSSSNSAATTTLTGTVIDGYLQGAKVCLDINANGVCDSGEPTATTGANGSYSFSGVTTSAANAAILAEVPATAVDADTSAAVGTAFTLTAPAGASAVTPLTSLVHDKMLAGATQASAVAAVQQALGIPAASGVSVLSDYVALKSGATDQTNGYFRAHEAAKTVVAVLKQGKAALGASGVAATDRETLRALLGQAEAALQMQASSNAAAAGTMFSPAVISASSIPGAGTLRSMIAANNASAVAAAATQNVTINFDVVNGATTIGTTGCSTNALTLGTASTVGSLKDLRFYVSHVALIDANGNYAPVIMNENANQGGNVALLDFEDATNTCASTGTAATYTAISGRVAPGNYVGIVLTIGVPPALNHSNIAAASTPLPLQNSALNWSWQSGRKFTKIEFTANPVAPATTGVTTVVHLGSTGCMANPANGDVFAGCASPNRMHMKFASFDPVSQKIALDLGSLFGGLDLTTSKTWMSGKVANMMTSSPAYYYGKFQIDMATGLPINDGAAQTLFVIR